MTTFHDFFKPADDDFQVGDGATILHWTDRTAYTVIARTANTMTMQLDHAFVGQPNGQGDTSRDTNYERFPTGPTVVARKSTRRGVTGWRCQGQTVVAGRHYYRDPSF